MSSRGRAIGDEPWAKRSVVMMQGRVSDEAVVSLCRESPGPWIVCEGRPTLEASDRVTRVMTELGLRPTVTADNMAGHFFACDWVRTLVVAFHEKSDEGYLCDIGALPVVILARRHGVPVRWVPGQGKIRWMGGPEDLLTIKGRTIVRRRISCYVPLMEWVDVDGGRA